MIHHTGSLAIGLLLYTHECDICMCADLAQPVLHGKQGNRVANKTAQIKGARCSLDTKRLKAVLHSKFKILQNVSPPPPPQT